MSRERFAQLGEHMKAALSSALRPGEAGPPKRRLRLRGRWKKDLPLLAEKCVDQVEGLAAAPLLTGEQKERVSRVALPIMEHMKERNGKTQELRRHRRHLRKRAETEAGEVQEELDRVLLENHILRGGSLIKES